MSSPTWSIQDAKNRFSAVVDAAQRGEPQWVTRRGKPIGVLLSAERLQRFEKAAAPSFTGALLDLPQDDLPFERMPLRQRDVEF
jgi:prevent-host-death family protein